MENDILLIALKVLSQLVANGKPDTDHVAALYAAAPAGTAGLPIDELASLIIKRELDQRFGSTSDRRRN